MGLGYVGAFGAKGGQEGFDHWMKSRLEQQLAQERTAQQAFENQMREKEFASNEAYRQSQQEALAETRAQATEDRQFNIGNVLGNALPGGMVMPDNAQAAGPLAKVGLLRTMGDINRGGPAPPSALAAIDDAEPKPFEEPGTINHSPARPGTGGRLVVKLPSAQQNEQERDDLRAETEHQDSVARNNKQDELNAELRRQNAGANADRAAAAKQQAAAANVQLTDDALNQAADLYNAGGPLPTGSGAAANAKRTQVQNRAAQRNPGVSLVLSQANLRADTKSLEKMTNMHDAVRAFERTADKNGDTMLDVARKLTSTRSPYLNMPIREFEKAVGDPDLARFNVARLAVVDEYAKILTSPTLTGQLTDTQQRQVDGLISGSMPLGAVIGALDTLRLDAKNREDSTVALISEINARMHQRGNADQGPEVKVDTPTPQNQTPQKKQIRYDENGNRLSN